MFYMIARHSFAAVSDKKRKIKRKKKGKRKKKKTEGKETQQMKKKRNNKRNLTDKCRINAYTSYVAGNIYLWQGINVLFDEIKETAEGLEGVKEDNGRVSKQDRAKFHS